jgi:hypothetical protein
MKRITILALALWASTNISLAQYNACAAKSEVTETVTREVKDAETGAKKIEQVQVAVQNRDGFGNASGNQYDLAVDGAFEGQTIVVLQLYTGENFDFEKPKAALKEKGFSVYRYSNQPPSAQELKKSLDKACQFWLISSTTQMLTEEHVKVIREFYESGKGVYIWGDNDPYHADADYLANALVGVTMSGYYMGNQTVTFKTESSVSGMRKDHLITTGLENVFEGITISTVHDPNNVMTPLIWSTDGNVVTSILDDQQHRLIIDGGFTRLYCNWDSAGTGRYIKNAAAWLVNVEKFGDAVVSNEIKKGN